MATATVGLDCPKCDVRLEVPVDIQLVDVNQKDVAYLVQIQPGPELLEHSQVCEGRDG